MRAFLFLTDGRDRACAEAVLRRLGCTEISTNPDDIGNGDFQYAIVQVYDETEELLRYDMDEKHSRLQQLKRFVDAHAESYVIAITYGPCKNDGSLSYKLGADWWLRDVDIELLLESSIDHAHAAHHAVKGVPLWVQQERAKAG